MFQSPKLVYDTPSCPPSPLQASLMSTSSPGPLSHSTINPKVTSAQYAVRGELVIKAMEYEKTIQAAREASRPSGLDFDRIIYCNIGNPQQLQQKPITFFRQVLALVDYPQLIEHPSSPAIFPPDAIARAREILAAEPGGTGAYSQSQGIAIARRHVAEFIAARDGHEASAEDVFLTEGASAGVAAVIKMLVRDESDGIMVPIPQYPLYTATLALCGGQPVGYYLNEAKGWGLEMSEMKRALADARAKGINVRAVVVINPGNPTGQNLSENDIKGVVQFCQDENLVMLADEVYQANVYKDGDRFTSFKKVVRDLQSPIQLFSFHSTSKGVIGECGRRGGYLEITNIPADVKEQLYKLVSIGLCSNVNGQIMVDLMVAPPKSGDVSYPLYNQEVTGILSSLKRRATKLGTELNTMKNISCTSLDGAMYAFPSVRLPPAAIAAAKAAGKEPGTWYALELLKATGVCVVPGGGFGQVSGTQHFRTTFLPPEEAMDDVIMRMRKFNDGLMAKYEA